MGKKKKVTGKHKPSSGKDRTRRINRAINLAEKKIRKWKRYQAKGKDPKRFSTTKLEKHIEYMMELL